MQVFGARGEMAFHEHVAGWAFKSVSTFIEAQLSVGDRQTGDLLLRVVVLALLIK